MLKSLSTAAYNRLLLLVAGLGGLLFGIDVGIISGALPYLEATSRYSSGELSFIVAAVLLGTIFSTVFAGVLADLLGRKRLMLCSGLLFVVSIPMIALSHNYISLVLGRILQGCSGGLIGVVAPLYLAECLGASNRGKGTGIFQWLLTMGIMAAAVIGFVVSLKVAAIERLHDPAALFAFKDSAWRRIFWISLPPGILFVFGTFLVAESPRWLFRHGHKEAALAALLRSRAPAQAELELNEMEQRRTAEEAGIASGEGSLRSLFSRRYLVPFVLACIILACNQATGINSIIFYNPTMLIQAGLNDSQAHLGNVVLTLINFLVTIVGVSLVDKKGRKFLLSLGTAGVIVSLVCAGLLFKRNEAKRLDVKDVVQTLVVQSNQTAKIEFTQALAGTLSGDRGAVQPWSLVVLYSYGDFHAASKAVRSSDPEARIELSRDSCLPPNGVVAFFKEPFANLRKSMTAPLLIEHALLTPVPPERNGWLTGAFIFCFIAFFALGPGVCVWLALSELMPTRIRSNGMSIALLLNHIVSTTIAATFLPTVGKHGYSAIFFLFAGCTVVYFITATFFLPETKGKTLEEIEEYFGGH